jgi:hypothetical protein
MLDMPCVLRPVGPGGVRDFSTNHLKMSIQIFSSWIIWLYTHKNPNDALFLASMFSPLLGTKARLKPKYKISLNWILYCLIFPLVSVAISAKWYFCKVDPVTYDECGIYWGMDVGIIVEYFMLFVVNFPLCGVQEAYFRSTLYWNLVHRGLDEGNVPNMGDLYTPLTASFVAGTLQAFWHFPLFLFHQPFYAGSGWSLATQFVGYWFYQVMLSLFLARIYNEIGMTEYSLAESRQSHDKQRYPHENTWAKWLGTTIAYTSISAALSVGGISRLRYYPYVLGCVLGIVNFWTGINERGGWRKLASSRVWIKDFY